MRCMLLVSGWGFGLRIGFIFDSMLGSGFGFFFGKGLTIAYSSEVMYTDCVLRVKIWTFNNVGKETISPATSRFPTTPTPCGFTGSLIRHGSGSLIPLLVANLGKIN